ncbi:MAG: nuclear transport factor 2 family protein [Alphaproteobacteria bacterium]|nr:nuclear transport factor 2 family protein [Alphaproteobacteria bacterium]
MSIVDIAKDVAALNAANKGEEAGAKYWADDVVSREAMDGPMAELRGKEAVKGKSDWWYANHTVHKVDARGVFVKGDEFAIAFYLDVTPNDSGQRMQMEELGLYKVKNGKIVEESFFPKV